LFTDIILKDLDVDISNYKTKHVEYSDKQEENTSNIVSTNHDNFILLNQVKGLKQHINTLQFERDQLERRYKEKLEDNDVSRCLIFHYRYLSISLYIFFICIYRKISIGKKSI